MVDELKAVFDPRGGQWFEGKYVPSLLAAIGGVIERHMIDIGFMPRPGEAETARAAMAASAASSQATASSRDGTTGTRRLIPHQCPKCGEAALIRQEGCDLCTSCGHSKCG